MKIHKKILTHYLSCTSPVDKEGYLFKKKERNATYQRRWFVLKGNLLFYQERPADRHLLGVIVLEGCAVRRSESDGQFAFSLIFEGPGLKTYRFLAVDRSSQESWKPNSNMALVNPVTATPSVPSHSHRPAFSPLRSSQQQRRNAYVTPLNGPAPLYGEWPLVGLDPLEEFSKLHDYYGQEVKKAREEWLKSRQAKEEEALIDLG
ncbi:Sesquipedalian-1 [Channa argus]|uniref:Sesquipedalian n=1 Tax=Channa argus TaxID=215402 RepID=A0A6G1QB19_CHAAH|nr:Sesquipedalian-1 [Channa argus]